MAVKPWKGAIKAPTNPPEIDSSAPNKDLELEYCNGYRCEDSRSNLFWTSNPGETVYMSAAIGVVHEIESN